MKPLLLDTAPTSLGRLEFSLAGIIRRHLDLYLQGVLLLNITAFASPKVLGLSLLVSFSALVAACTEAPDVAIVNAESETTAPAMLGERRPDGALSEERSAERARRVSAVSYGLITTLDPALDYYAGQVDIVFELDGADHDLTLDFGDGEVVSMQVNGEGIAIDEAVYNGQFITISASDLAEGANTVVVVFQSPWSNDGSGLYRFVDPEDGRSYTYTDLEPYDAHRWFPNFDQPDIKAHLKQIVSAPADWQVITNTRESEIADLPESAGGGRTWTFPATSNISTYLMHLSAGPYMVWEDAEFRYPLRIFARQALAEYMDEELWFEIARAQFDFFDEYTGYPYPYLKYDQIIVPDFNAGAMENVAAVTWNEGYIERDGRDADEATQLAMVHAHELAHMWFGDLVTPIWWDNLWLNESFAEWAGFHAAEATGYEGAWAYFYTDWKTSGYRADLRSTTHAVQTHVATTDNVLDNFDSLTYAKGGAVLRQLEFLVGSEVYRDGLRIYLARHAESNATGEDLIAAVAEAAGPDFPVDLAAWGRDWIYTASLNTLSVDMICVDGAIESLAIDQTAPRDHPLLRTQRVQLGLYSRDGDAVVTDNVFPVLISGARTEVPEAAGARCPDLAYPNHGDMGYALVDLDPITRGNLVASIADVADPFQRLMFWVTLYDQVRIGDLPATDYLDVALAAAANEQDRTVIYEVYWAIGVVTGYLEQMGDASLDALAEYGPRVEAMMWQRVLDADTDLRTLLFDRYRAAVVSESGYDNLAAMLDGDVTVEGFTFDQGRRWGALGVLADAGYPGVWERAQAEFERDGSRSGQLAMIAIEASLPDAGRQSRFLDIVLDPDTESSWSDVRSMARSLFPAGQSQMHAAVSHRILESLSQWETAGDSSTLRVARLVAGTLAPTGCTVASVSRMADLVEAHQGSRSGTLRALTRGWEDDALCVARVEALSPD
jgi:aminopeptidase N